MAKHRTTVVLVEPLTNSAPTYTNALRADGFDVILVERAEEAFALCVDPTHAVDLVICRLVLEGMTGPELERALERVCQSPVLLISSYPRQSVMNVRGFHADLNILEEPVEIDIFIARAHAALRNAGTRAAT